METFADGLSLHTIETPSLGDRSYVAIHDGWAVAVDVQRDLDRVEDLLREHDARLGATAAALRESVRAKLDIARPGYDAVADDGR